LRESQVDPARKVTGQININRGHFSSFVHPVSAQVLWRAAIVAATAAARRNKGAWSSLGLGLSLGDFLGDILGHFLGDILAKYGASLRERVVRLQLLQLCMVLVLRIWRLSLLCATLGEGALYLS
jgi:hypothetical protein